MQQKSERGVPPDGSPAKQSINGTPDWDGARIFLDTIRHGSFRAAAQAQGVALVTLRRRFEDFEQSCGVTLATRGAFGIHLTAAGRKIFEAVQKMETSYFDVLRARDQTGSTMDGRVRLAVTEGLGTFWIAPRLIEFQRAFPKLMVEMHCSMSPPDILRLEADVGIQLSQPENKDLIAVRLGRVHAMPFAAPSYVNTYGTPKTVQEFAQHRIVMQMSPNIPSEAVFRTLFPGAPVESLIVFQSNVSSAHYWSVAKGAGIGILPTYANAMGAPVVAIDIRDDNDPSRMLRWHSDIWLSCHPDTHRIPRVQRLIAWLRNAFSSKLYPWFADDFIHPDDLPVEVDQLPLMNFFAGFSATDAAGPALQTLEDQAS